MIADPRVHDYGRALTQRPREPFPWNSAVFYLTWAWEVLFATLAPHSHRFFPGSFARDPRLPAPALLRSIPPSSSITESPRSRGDMAREPFGTRLRSLRE